MLGVHSFGNELRAVALSGIHVAETAMPPHLVLAGHAHEPGQICFVLEGEYRERIYGGESDILPGDVQFHSPGEWHENIFSTGGALALLISVDRDRWVDVPARRPFRSRLLAGIAADVRRELERHDAGSAGALEALSLLLLSELPRLTSEPEWLRHAAFRIEQQFARPISLSSVATEVGVHRATLAAAFRRFRGTSVGELIRSVRVARAREALSQTQAPIDEVAQQCGFADQAHLTRVFKRLTGVTPGEFRRSYTSKSSKWVSSRKD